MVKFGNTMHNRHIFLLFSLTGFHLENKYFKRLILNLNLLIQVVPRVWHMSRWNFMPQATYLFSISKLEGCWSEWFPAGRLHCSLNSWFSDGCFRTVVGVLVKFFSLAIHNFIFWPTKVPFIYHLLIYSLNSYTWKSEYGAKCREHRSGRWYTIAKLQCYPVGILQNRSKISLRSKKNTS